MNGTAVQIADEGAIVRITLDGDEQLNALTPATMEALQRSLAQASADESTRVVVLAGEGHAFCAGADLARLPDDRNNIMPAAGAVIRQIVETPVPVIAAVHGVATGYGASLVAAADIVLAAESASLSMPFARLGLMPDGGLTHTLPAAVGRPRAAELVFSGRQLAAADAAEAGLISRVVPDTELARAIDALAQHIAQTPRRALVLTKQALHASNRDLLDSALERERVGQTELLDNPEFPRLSAPWAH